MFLTPSPRLSIVVSWPLMVLQAVRECPLRRTVAQDQAKTAKNKKTSIFFFKFNFFLVYFVSQSYGMTHKSIGKGIFIVLCPQIQAFPRIRRNFCFIQSED